MSDANKTLAKRFFDGINARNLDVIEDLVSPNYVEHEELPGVPPNRDGVRQWFELITTAFDGFRMDVDQMLADGDMVVIRGTMKGKHTGEFMGVPPTGKTVNVAFADFLRFAGGQCVEHWGVTDTGAMMQQLGQG